MTIIIGAGLAGLIAANTAFQNAVIYESQSKEDFKKHMGVLRFRSPKIGEALGVNFQKVLVHKSIYSEGKHHNTCTIKHANDYSFKVSGVLSDRSIWNIESVERWIAPDAFHDIMLSRCANRIAFDQKITSFNANPAQQIISTMPLPVAANIAQINTEEVAFTMQKISVIEFDIPGANVHQTIYFPDEFQEFPDDTSYSRIYRATITGSRMIVEAACSSLEYPVFLTSELDMVFAAFGLKSIKHSLLDQGSTWEISNQGKISPIDNVWRRNLLHTLTDQHGVYSLGRFACWRQILLDDVLQDVYRIKHLIESDNYTRRAAR